MRLADARALVAGLAVAPADPETDRRALMRLALWCGRFTPRVALDGEDGLLLDIAGCAHLFGGEAAMMEEIAARLAGLGLEAQAGLADTPGAAWALARFASAGGRIAAPGGARAALKTLPVEALRISPEAARSLRRLGLTAIDALIGLPRTTLERRFPSRKAGAGAAVLPRLDRALGRIDEPVTPLVPPPVHLERRDFADPLLHREGLEAALAELMSGLVASLRRDRSGARRLVLWCFRADGGTVRRTAAASRPTRDRGGRRRARGRVAVHGFSLLTDVRSAGAPAAAALAWGEDCSPLSPKFARASR